MKKSIFFSVVSLIGFSMFFSSLHAAGIVVSNNASGGSFPLVANNIAAPIVVDIADAEVVRIVAQAFSGDVKLLTGATPLIKNSIDTTFPVIIGTLGKSALINQLAALGKIDKSRLEGKWETFCISVVNNPLPEVEKALVIAGSDPRGTAFGVFELSRKMGVSPWVWWADVIPETRNGIYISGDNVFGPPAVKYRGLFINDEDWGLQPWAARNMDKTINGGKGDIGPRTHEKIFELLLRTKSNYLWPAMHACTKAFWYYTENPQVARRYAIVMGSSHCEPMLRNNEDEWRRNFASEYPGVVRGDWNWKTNSTVIKNYWIDRVKQSKNTDAIYTLGMRDVHDDQMQGYDTDKERAEALKLIIGSQRDILQTHIGKPKETIPQLFCPYKEVLLQYNEGIDLPDDVTLLWPDDNHGYIRQLSNPTEQLRSGGGGIYYHLSYLGPPRQDYLWLSSTSPAKISYEMSKAYDLNARNIWVFNVGDIKPAEFEYQFAMDLAWDVDAWRPEKAYQYMKFWADETFGSLLADDIAEIQSKHYQLSASGRPDQIDWAAFSFAEMEQRLAKYAELVEKVKSVESRIPERLKAAYFQLIVYPVHGSAAMNEKILGSKLSFDYASRGRITQALDMADRSRDAYRKIRDLTYTYNKVMANGKWDGVMSYSPMSRGFFYDPIVVTSDVIPSEPVTEETPEQTVVIPAKDYQSKSASVKVIEELGVDGSSLAVLPLNMTQYTASDITSAPNVDYKIRLSKGSNLLRVKFLPTFPLYPGLDLRYAISIDGGTPQFVSLKTLEKDSKWRSNILRGYSRSDMNIESESEKDVMVKIYFADPGLVINSLEVSSVQVSPLTKLIVNPDFELNASGNILTGINRGNPYGWSRQGTLNGNSFGTNQDASNFHGQNVCWYSSTPMPSNFELYQTISGLPAGEYILRCQLAVPRGRMTTQRLFANKYVQYYGKEADYVSNLTSGEINRFAGYEPDFESGSGDMISLKEMALKFVLVNGESMKLGIRTNNRNSDGTYVTDNVAGWFKVDHFRLERVRELTVQDVKAELEELIATAQQLLNTTKAGTAGGEYPQVARNTFQSGIQAALTVSQNSGATMAQSVMAIENLKKSISNYKKSVNSFTSFIVNASFEYKSEGVLNDGTTYRGTPYGWRDTGGINGISFGINKDAVGLDGNNVCWYLSSPMPSAFELYQQLEGLPAGKYTVSCKLAVENGKLTTQRLFANNNVQYYGYEMNYGVNLVGGENISYAIWGTSSNYALMDMKVEVELADGEPLKLGIRTSNQKADGSLSTSTDGWFKVDNFRLELKELRTQTGLERVENDLFKVRTEPGFCHVNFREPFEMAHIRVVSLSGVVVYSKKVNQQNTRIPLPRGLYVILASVDNKSKSCKVLVN